MDKNRLLTRKEVEELFGLSVRFLELAAMKGEGPSFLKLGHRTVRYRVCDLEAWIEHQSGRAST